MSDPIKIKANVDGRGLIVDLEIDRTGVITWQGEVVGRTDAGVVEAMLRDSVKGLSIQEGL
jgi:hypothetical protein